MSQPSESQPFTKVVHREVYDAISPSQPSLSIKGKTLLITGATQGIGYAIATAYAAAGASNVVITARDQSKLINAKTNLEKAYPATKIHTFVAEMDDKTRTSSLFAEIRASIAEPGVLVLNAGSGNTPSPALELSDDSLVKDFDINVKGNLSYVAEFLKPETLTKEKTISNVSSIGAQLALPGLGSYGATKVAMVHLLTHIQGEHPDKNVRIVNFHPGTIFTSLAKSSGYQEDSYPWDNGTKIPILHLY